MQYDRRILHSKLRNFQEKPQDIKKRGLFILLTLALIIFLII
jgi:hypothetical protein